jgi:hypothetical protein
MSYIKLQITPPSPLIFAILNGGSKRRMILADLVSPRGKPAENIRHLSSLDGVGRLGWGLVWLISPTAYGFLMISPNLHDIWAMFFLILSRYLKLVLYLGFWAMAIHCRAAKNSLRGTVYNLLVKAVV